MGSGPARWGGPWRLLAVIAGVLLLVATAPAQGLSPLEAVDVAGRERMLSQRVTKAWLMRAQGLLVDEAETILDSSITHFETQLDTLRSALADAESRATLDSLVTHWQAMKLLLDAPADATTAAALYDANEAVQSAAHRLTLACEDRAPAPYASLVNLAGRQRMLSQRMAKFFLYRSGSINGDAADMELELAHAHFNAVLIRLEVSRLLDDASRTEIAALRTVWQAYEALLVERDTVDTMRANAAAVARASEEVLGRTERVVAAIMQAAQRQGNAATAALP